MGHRTCLGDIMAGQTYPIYARTGTNHARHFIGSRYIFAASKMFKVTLEKKTDR